MVVTKASMEGPKESERELGPLEKLSKEANSISHDKGWYIEAKTFGDYMFLIHTEISEAGEEFRNGHKRREVYAGDKVYYQPDDHDFDELETLAANGVKPEGIGVELADALIRIFDFAGEYGLDLDALVRIKTAYNRTRPYRHGGKVL